MLNKVISISTWLILLVLAGCGDAPPYVEEPSAQERTITLNLDITTGAVTDPEETPGNFNLWIFNNDKLLKYIGDNPVWEEVYSGGIDLKATVEAELDVAGATTIQFYLLLNGVVANPLEMTPEQLKTLTFTLPEQPYSHDNKVPMTGETEVEITIDQLNYDIEIDAVRSVGKLEVYCTRESELSNLTVKKLTLNHIPDKGYLFGHADVTGITYGGSEVLFNGEMDIQTVLPGNETEAGSTFEDYQERFTPFSFTQPYLLENLTGGDDDTAIVGNGNGDDNVTPDKESRYYVTIEYVLNGMEESRNIYLPAIPRNTLDKLFIRINDNGNRIQLHWYVEEWEDGGTLDIDGGMHPTTTFTDYNANNSGATDQHTWYSATIDSSTPDLMTNAARYTFKMSTNHEWNMTCSNITDFNYKIFKLQDDGNYIDIETIQQQPVRAKGTYAICVYPRNPLANPAQQCTISFSYYNTYMQKWETLPDETTKATITQVSAKTINDEGL